MSSTAVSEDTALVNTTRVRADGAAPSTGLNRTAIIIVSVVAALLLVGAAVGVVLAFTLKSDDTGGSSDGLERFAFDHIFNSSFNAYTVTPQWVSGGASYTYTKDGTVRLHVLETGADTVLFDPATVFPGKSLAAHSLAADGKHLLVAVDAKKIWRHSFLGTWYVVDLTSDATAQIGDTGVVQAAKWSPSSTSLAVAFVMSNNVYVAQKNSSDQWEWSAITTDGTDTIINGINGWLYEEEVYSDSPVFWWSPAGKYLAWLRTNETLVPEYSMSKYLDGGVYPEIQKIRYPKPGKPNPRVTLLVWEMASDNITAVVDASVGDANYASAVSWLSDDTVTVRRLARLQNSETLIFVDSSSGEVTEVKSRTATGWLEEKIGVYHLPQNMQRVVEIVVKGEYPQIVLRSTVDGSEVQLTRNEFAATEYIGFSVATNEIVYQAATTQIERHLYVVGIDGKNNRLLLEQKDRVIGSWWSGSCVYPCDWVLVTNGGPGVPTQMTVRVDRSVNATVVNDNAKLTEFLTHFKMPKSEYFVTRDASNMEDLNGWALYPPDFDSSKKYPVLFYVYGGPGSQEVKKAYYTNWFHMYMATKGYIVVSVDPRGTIARKDNFVKSVYLRGGVAAAEDQIAAAKAFKTRKYVKSVGIWGWSFGGYVTAMTMTSAGVSEAFSTGVSVAPVTDWHYYDSCYTERFMSLPELNAAGYNETSALRRTSNLAGKYMLIHGTGDDNVHFMNSCMFNEALVQSGKQFSAMWYVDRDHSINTLNARPHLYHMIDNFLEQHLF